MYMHVRNLIYHKLDISIKKLRKAFDSSTIVDDIAATDKVCVPSADQVMLYCNLTQKGKRERGWTSLEMFTSVMLCKTICIHLSTCVVVLGKFLYAAWGRSSAYEGLSLSRLLC